MIRRALGTTCVSCLFALAGVTAVGAGGYMTLTGQSLCSMVHGCGEKTTTADNKTVTTVAAKEGEGKSCCPLAKLAAAKASGGCSGEKVASSHRKGFYLMNGAVPIAMPAMFYDKNAKFCSASLASMKEVGGCSTPCSAEGKVEVVAATSASGCCKGKTAATTTVAAKEAPTGCCKGTGVRADGTACQKDGEHCKSAEKSAEAPKTDDTGKPIASRQ